MVLKGAHWRLILKPSALCTSVHMLSCTCAPRSTSSCVPCTTPCPHVQVPHAVLLLCLEQCHTVRLTGTMHHLRHHLIHHHVHSLPPLCGRTHHARVPHCHTLPHAGQECVHAWSCSLQRVATGVPSPWAQVLLLAHAEQAAASQPVSGRGFSHKQRHSHVPVVFGTRGHDG